MIPADGRGESLLVFVHQLALHIRQFPNGAGIAVAIEPLLELGHPKALIQSVLRGGQQFADGHDTVAVGCAAVQCRQFTVANQQESVALGIFQAEVHALGQVAVCLRLDHVPIRRANLTGGGIEGHAAGVPQAPCLALILDHQMRTCAGIIHGVTCQVGVDVVLVHGFLNEHGGIQGKDRQCGSRNTRHPDRVLLHLGDFRQELRLICCVEYIIIKSFFHLGFH